MDKVTRMLWMYSALARGTPVSKELFCIETQSLPRSFDRDIEDIRLFLSESYDHRELIYNRKNNHYTMGDSNLEPLDSAEILLLVQLLTECRILKQEEYDPFVQNLIQHGTNDAALSLAVSDLTSNYKEPVHQTALLKMYSDLNHVICNKNIIRIRYIDEIDVINEYVIFPCYIRLEFEQLSLMALAYGDDDLSPSAYPLERIQSFSIEGTQSHEESMSVAHFLEAQSLGSVQKCCDTRVNVRLSCTSTYSARILQRFPYAIRTNLMDGRDTFELEVSEGEFVQWVLGQPVNLMEVHSPESTIALIKSTVENLATHYL